MFHPLATVLGLGIFSIVGGVLFISWRKGNVRAVDVLLLIACLLAGALRTHFALRPYKNEASFFANAANEILLFGIVAGSPEQRGARYRFPVIAEKVKIDSGWVATQGRVLVSGDSLGDVRVGEKLLLPGFLRLPDASRNPGAFDYRAYLQAQDIIATFSCRHQKPLWREPPQGGWEWRQIISQTKNWIETRLASFSQNQRLALLKGLLIGERDEISKEIVEAFSRTGLVHILAVSGSNVGFVALMMVTALYFLRVSRRWHPPFLLIGIFFYMFLTGAQPPVVRATIMATVIIIGDWFEREADIYNSLGVAALIILLWQPLQLFQLGFQLSFAAMLGIVYLHQPLTALITRVIHWEWRPIRLAVMLLAVSLAAQFATLPFSLQAFGRLPLIAILGNLLVIPTTFVIISASTLACIFSFVEFLSQTFGYIADLTTGGMIVFTHWLSTLPLAYADAVYVPPLLLLFYVIVIVTLVEWQRSPLARPYWLLAGCVILNIFVWQRAWAAGPKLRLTFFDVGQGDAALLEFPQGRLLIDTGPLEEKSDAAERVLIPYFRRNGIRELDAVVITHPHADHLGGLPTLLREVAIKKVFICGVEINSPLEQSCEKLLDSLRVPYSILSAGERLADFAPAEILTLHPYRQERTSLHHNDASVVLKIIFGRHSFFFPGDAEVESESHMLKFADGLGSDILKVGHHGSRTSSMPQFLAAVSPQWAIASVGRWNRFGHPDPQVVARYDSLKIQLLRTDHNGAVIFETDGKIFERIR